uniref:Uncharacterized protein n=1 Tax=Tanacetum cinerariifolium TaxID=118510 RepID=A0A6L2LJT3_TANCI|nr:hypothetical protein [Tanacetum cinerariifolium]
MSDSKESGVTYTDISNYIPGPEHTDDEIVAEDQPYAEDASAIAQSPKYVPESDFEMHLEDDDDEDPEEDPVDYPADGGDDGPEHADDEIVAEEADEEEGEEEHPAPADSVVVAPTAADQVPSAEETEPFKTDESAATPPPHPAYRTTARISIPAPVPMPAWTDSEVVRLLAISSPPASPLSPWSSPPPQIPSPPLPPILSPPSPILAPAPPPSPIHEHNVIIDSLDTSYDKEQIDQDDDDLANERDLLASLIERLKCEIDDSKNHNKFLETTNKALVDKLKDLKKFQAELDRYHDVKYASNVEIDCAKAKGDLMSYKMESEKSFNEYTRKINDLNQTILEMKKEQFAHQETISILSQEKEAQLKFYKTREDKEIDKVIALENKIKDLDNIVYKTGQSVQTMNMLNHNCKTSFAKLEFLKKARRANPRLYDIGCYNDNLALMLAPESDEVIRLEKESRSKLSDLIRPFDYDKLNNLYDLFVSQREKSSAQRYFSKRINADLEKFHLCLKEEMVADLRYFNSLKLEVDSLTSQLETQKTQFLSEIDRLSREYYYGDHMNAILGVYTELDEVTNLQCDYLETLEKCECLEQELSKSKMRLTS